MGEFCYREGLFPKGLPRLVSIKSESDFPGVQCFSMCVMILESALGESVEKRKLATYQVSV